MFSFEIDLKSFFREHSRKRDLSETSESEIEKSDEEPSIPDQSGLDSSSSLESDVSSLDFNQPDSDSSASSESDSTSLGFNQPDRPLNDVETYTMLLIMQTLKNLTNDSIETFVRIKNLNLPKDIRLNVSYETMIKKCSLFTPGIEKYYFLNDTGCVSPISVPYSTANSPNPFCGFTCKHPIKNPNSNFFLNIKLKDWLEYMIPRLYDRMNFKQTLESSGILHDVTDGSEYKRLHQYHKKVLGQKYV